MRSPLGSGRRGRALPPQASLGRHGPNSSGRRGPCPPPPRFPRLRTQVSRRPRPRLHGNTACLRDARPGTRSSRSLSAAGGTPTPTRQRRLAASGTRVSREGRGETHLPGAAPRRGRCLNGLLASSLRTQLPTAIGQERWELFHLLYDIHVGVNLFGVDSRVTLRGAGTRDERGDRGRPSATSGLARDGPLWALHGSRGTVSRYRSAHVRAVGRLSARTAWVRARGFAAEKLRLSQVDIVS